MQMNYYFDREKPLHPFAFSAEANVDSEQPMNALRVEPLFKTGFWPCEKNGVWVLVEDHRAGDFYSKVTGEKVQIKDVGALPEEVTSIERPDNYHTWNGAMWVMTDAVLLQKQEQEKEMAVNQAKSLLVDANHQIEVLQDRIELEVYDSDEELSALQAELKRWKRYRITLNQFIKGEITTLPEGVI